MLNFTQAFPLLKSWSKPLMLCKPIAENMYNWSQMQRLSGEGSDDFEKLRSSLKQCKLSLLDQFYLVLQKLGVGTFNQVLAGNLNIRRR